MRKEFAPASAEERENLVLLYKYREKLVNWCQNSLSRFDDPPIPNLHGVSEDIVQTMFVQLLGSDLSKLNLADKNKAHSLLTQRLKYDIENYLRDNYFFPDSALQRRIRDSQYVPLSAAKKFYKDKPPSENPITTAPHETALIDQEREWSVQDIIQNSTTLDQREKAIAIDHLVNGLTETELAKKYGYKSHQVADQRLHSIYSKLKPLLLRIKRERIDKTPRKPFGRS